MKKEILNKPNQLISILPEKSISLVQQKSFNIFLRTAQQIVKFSDDRKYEEIDKEKRYIFKIPCRELKEKAGLDKQDYNYIKNELEKLMKIVITVVDKENKDNWSMFHLLERVEKEEGNFKYFLDGFIVKALKEHDFFTTLDLMQIRELNSKYSVFFYELAIRYQKYKIPKMSIKELRELTNTQKKYSRFEAFRRRVLDITCEEVSEKTDITLTYKTEKKGRKIAFIDFEIKRKHKDIVEIETKEIKEIKDYSEQVLELFELLADEEQVEGNKETLSKLLNKYDFELIKSDIIYAKKQDTQKFMAYLSKSCQSGHYSKVEFEKQQRKKEVQQKAKTYKQEQQKILQKIKLEAWELAKEKYLELRDEEKKNYLKGYEMLLPMFKTTKEDYIISAIQAEIEERLKQEQGIYWVEEKKD